jgi:hypothetical protein
MTQYSHKDITAFINAIIRVSRMVEVHNNRIVWTDGDPVVVQLKDKKAPLFTYTRSPDDPDAIVLNPLHETMTSSVDRIWFYKQLNLGFVTHLQRTIKFLVEIVLHDCQDKPELLKYMKGIDENDIDEKFLKELEFLYNTQGDGFFSISYNAAKKTTKVFAGVEDPTGEYQKAVPSTKFRKKSWKLLTTIIRNLLRVNDDETIASKYETSTDNLACPQFLTFVPTWHKLWVAIAPACKYTMESLDISLEADLSEIEEHLPNILTYNSMSNWAASVHNHKPNLNKIKSAMTATTRDVLLDDTEVVVDRSRPRVQEPYRESRNDYSDAVAALEAIGVYPKSPYSRNDTSYRARPVDDYRPTYTSRSISSRVRVGYRRR